MGIAFTVMALLTRSLIRAFINRGWGHDDSIIIAATVCFISCALCKQSAKRPKVLHWIQSGLVLGACADGLGKSIRLVTPRRLDSIEKVSLSNTMSIYGRSIAYRSSSRRSAHYLHKACRCCTCTRCTLSISCCQALYLAHYAF
jgi:hypothetical protein